MNPKIINIALSGKQIDTELLTKIILSHKQPQTALEMLLNVYETPFVFEKSLLRLPKMSKEDENLEIESGVCQLIDFNPLEEEYTQIKYSYLKTTEQYFACEEDVENWHKKIYYRGVSKKSETHTIYAKKIEVETEKTSLKNWQEKGYSE